MTPVEQIKARLSVVDVVSSYLKLARAGSNFKAVCPFHSEKSPSFFVSPARDVWHCFGCNRGGDQFRFVMEIEGVEFREALGILANRAGVELQREDPKERDERARLLALLEEITTFYEESLQRDAQVSAYLISRGVKPETIAKFRIGYAPPESITWRACVEFALQKGYTLQELEKSGLSIRKQQSSPNVQLSNYYDRFRNRIMFPIADSSGRTVGFGGRIFEPRMRASHDENAAPSAKYINTPQTTLYDKSRILYAFDKAKMAIRKENKSIVVEGYMDAVMAHQAGTEHTVAVSGTALTQPQLVMLRRLGDGLITAFDMDNAGESATRRSIDLALSMGFDVRAVSMPGKDPADIVKENPATWQNLVESAGHVVAYFLDKLSSRVDIKSLEGRREVSRILYPLIGIVPQETEKAHWIGVVASRLGVREEAVWQDIARGGYKTGAAHGEGELSKHLSGVLSSERTRSKILQERILGILLTHGISTSPVLTEHLFSDPQCQSIFAAIVTHGSQGPSAVHTALRTDELQTYADRLVFETEMLVSKAKAEGEYAACVSELNREIVRNDLERLTADIRVAEKAGNDQQVTQLTEEFRDASKKLTSV